MFENSKQQTNQCVISVVEEGKKSMSCEQGYLQHYNE